MKKHLPWLLAFVFLFVLGTAQPVSADGIIIPDPCPPETCPPPPCREPPCPPFPPRPMEQLDIRYHHVDVTIEDQLALTKVDQVFYNPNDHMVEGSYVFPLPLEAVVTGFTLWIDGKPVEGQVLDAEQARAYYEETVRAMRDPALLEYQGRGAVKASVFPIAPGEERRIQLEYSQALTAQNGLVRYVYPLNTEKFSRVPLEDVRVRVEIRDRQALRAVYSPSHPVDVRREPDGRVIAGYEARNVLPDRDFSLFYSVGETEAFHLFSYRSPEDLTDPDGFFLLLLAPPAERPSEQERVAKDVLLVLDRSGSMEGEKFRQAQAALRYVLKKLNPEDRFYLQAFSTGLETYASGLRPANEANEALAWVDRLSAQGSTDIHRALLEAAAVTDRERPTYLIFLTDGLPTEGVTDRQQILDAVARAAPRNLRLFAFGVGYDVDTFLLDQLTQDHQGQSMYVRPGEPLDEILSAFYERISVPLMTDLSLDFGDLAVYDIYPTPLPDLFAGSQVTVVGRYRGGGETTVTLSGYGNGEKRTLRYPGQQFAADSRSDGGTMLEVIPRLWATRKIGALLNHIRLQGPDAETIEQIVRLSIRYGIVTPYTSYLVEEPMPLGAREQEKIALEAYGQAVQEAMPASGADAVERAAGEGAMRQAEVAPALEPGQGAGGENGFSGAVIRIAGNRTFLYRDGAWMDTTYDPERMAVQQIQFLSEAYFDLLASRPDLASALALGDQVTLVVDGKAYAVVREGGEGSVDIPALLPTSTSEPAVLPEPTRPAPAAPPNPVAVPAARQNGGALCLGAFLPAAFLLASAAWLRMRV